jgi:hypothetical protein
MSQTAAALLDILTKAGWRHEEDKCVWTPYAYGSPYWVTGCNAMNVVQVNTRWQFCPFCGVKIEVKP